MQHPGSSSTSGRSNLVALIDGNADGIDSKEGIGTTVTVYLPRHAGATVAKPLEEIAGEVGAEARETVLVVDDEPLVAG